MSSIQVFTIHVICQYFFPVCVFILFPVLLEEDTLLILMKSYLSFFSFMPHHAFGVCMYIANFCLTQAHKYFLW